MLQNAKTLTAKVVDQIGLRPTYCNRGNKVGFIWLAAAMMNMESGAVPAALQNNLFRRPNSIYLRIRRTRIIVRRQFSPIRDGPIPKCVYVRAIRFFGLLDDGNDLGRRFVEYLMYSRRGLVGGAPTISHALICHRKN
jgi:hypothetical protein